MTLVREILARARDLGFDLAGITPLGAPRHGDAFAAWLAAGYHGEMAYLAERAAARLDPAQWAPGARSLIALAVRYGAGAPAPRAAEPRSGRIARYARLPDYHDLIKPKLYALDAFIRARTGRSELGKVFVDTAPVVERDFTEQAGLGFIGRNCCLITPGLGSWTVLAGVMAPEVLEAGSWKLETGNVQQKEYQGCGGCRRCLDACPTHAFVAPHVLDARRCIAYLTIELRGSIPRDLRPLMGNWVFGCDVCQEVCPYNRSMRTGTTGVEASAGPVGNVVDRLGPPIQRPEAPPVKQEFRDAGLDGSLPLAELLSLDEAGFRAGFRGTPVLRAKRRGLVRNACVAAGNSGDPALIPPLLLLLHDPEPLVRGHAAWALARIDGAEARRALARALAVETDPRVRAELVP